jgi:hypothetical protein
MIRFITFEEQDYPVRVSYYALKMLKEELGRGLNPTDDGTDYDAYECLLFYALKKGHQKVTPNMEFPFKREQMEDVMDECYFEFMKIVPEFFSDETVEPKTGKKGSSGGKK